MNANIIFKKNTYNSKEAFLIRRDKIAFCYLIEFEHTADWIWLIFFHLSNAKLRGLRFKILTLAI